MSRLPSCTSRKVIQALQRGGWSVTNISGSHYRLRHPADPARFVIIPFHNRDLKRGTLTGVIKDAGLTIDEFIALL